MAPIKRFADSEGPAFKKEKHTADDRASKRQKKLGSSSNEHGSTTSQSVVGSTKSQKVPQPSIFKDEERAFPRGGASVLTPLEHKQIQIEATQDVLFEQAGNKRPGNGAESDDGVDEETEAAPRATKKIKKAKGSKKAADIEEARIRTEGLSYKRLVPGSMVLGQVTQITSRDIALALPNNLTGYIPLTAISDKLTSKIEKLLDDEVATENDGEEPEEIEDIDLNDLFVLGQYLRAYVTSTGEDSTVNGVAKSKKRIELSVNPKQANHGISKSDIVINSMLQASVLSNEDHGLVMDLGLGDDTLKGFMSSKELGLNVEHAEVQEGAVFLCLVTGLSSDGRIIKLSADLHKAGNLKKPNFLAEAPTIDLFLPGTAVDMLITDISSSGITGKIMGLLDVTADLIHSGAAESQKDISDKYKIGSKVKARIICTFPNVEPRRLGVSLLDHILSLSSRSLSIGKITKEPLQALPMSSFVEEAKVIKVEPTTGLFLDLGVRGILGFAHISRITDGKIETLLETTGAYKIGSKHRARAIGYNPMDGLYLVSLESRVLDQPFLRIEDIQIGQVVKGKVDKLIITKKGAAGVLVHLADGITGLVPEMHMADVHLQHPDRKFKEGLSVTARVLSVDLDKRQIRLTLKKTLVNSETGVWSDYSRISPGAKAPGTLINVLRNGAVVQFYADVRAWLPVSEMSEAYIEDPTQHFRIGQVVNVHVLSVEPENGKMTVSCKDTGSFGLEQQAAFKALKVGEVVKGSVTEKSADTVTVDLDSGIKGILRLGQLTDGSERKDLATLKRVRVGQVLDDLVILEKYTKKPMVALTNKPSLVKDARAAKLIASFEDVQEGQTVHGFVRGITPERVFIEFGGGVVGLLFKSQLAEDIAKLPDFGLRKDQSITARVTHVDHSKQRFWLSMKTEVGGQDDQATKKALAPTPGENVTNAVDGESKSTSEFSLGKATTARITSVKSTQVNVQLADNIQGRIDVSEMFDEWEDIKDKKHPLLEFRPKQIIPVRVLGIHDARNHRFLPITHRQGKVPVFELTAKKESIISSEKDLLTLDKVTVGSSWIAFVNNIADYCVWVNLSPNVRGRIEFMDLSDDVSLLSNVAENFPIGSALKVRVKNVDVSTNRLDLSATSSSSTHSLTWQSLKKGMVLPARVTKVTESSIIVQLNDSIAGPVTLTELADDYSQADPTIHKKGDIIRLCVTDIDLPNKKVGLSTRPSNVLSSSLPVKDPQISNISQLKVNDVVRGFVKNVADGGLFISLGPRVTAFVRISDISDAYIKDWKAGFEIDQLVTGKIIAVDSALNHVQMSLKASIIDKDYVQPLQFSDIKPGQIVTGKVRKVEDFGVFIVVDNSNNVSGLCHRSEIADGQKVEDVKALYKEGDAVKAKVLKLDEKKRRINFSLKYSNIKGSPEDSHDSDEDVSDGGVDIENSGSEGEVLEDDTEMRDVHSTDDEEEAEEGNHHFDEMDVDEVPITKSISGLNTSGFDWTGTSLGPDEGDAVSDMEQGEDVSKKKKKHRKPEIKIDRTGDLDKIGPQSVADFERLLLGQPNSAELWVRYMVFQRELNEIEKSRQIAKRALATIFPREEKEKLDVWTALLHLENDFSSDDTVEEVFKEACQYNDAREMHDRLIKIYIQSGKLDKTDSLYQSMIRNKSFTADPALWISYANFLMSTLSPPSPTRARALLQRATQSVPSNLHRNLTSKFGALEFKSPNGDAERGRTIFEGLVSAWPKKGDLWDMYVELERAHGEKENVRQLFERMVKLGMKRRRTMLIFRRWLDFEEDVGNSKGAERVKAFESEWKEKKEGVEGA
ncbi:rRNA biogenesis protein-like protein RRP5 [Glonium stellatum]|uniref:rRNA biogenesis protein RRP5 n=1 Tax=Glonium stellatum TaxID=574774 RepID=A0A8E2FDR1_9PEZI|nr:rRNA biogenesis protein-like protein RRP5 [Glonium stellatum]